MAKKGGFLAGLTGGIGTGKSSVLAEFSRLGAATVSLDEIAKDVVRPGSLGFRRVVKGFGWRFLAPDGTIDRVRLAREVFRQRRSRRRLESLLHPLILREMDRRIAAAGKARPVVVDVPLLFEKRLASRFDAVLLVTARRKTQLSRVARRDGLSGAQIRARLSSQLPQGLKRRLADVSLANDGSLSELQNKVKRYHRSFELMNTYPTSSQGGV